MLKGVPVSAGRNTGTGDSPPDGQNAVLDELLRLVRRMESAPVVRRDGFRHRALTSPSGRFTPFT